MCKNHFLKSWCKKYPEIKALAFAGSPSTEKRKTVILGVKEDVFSIPDNFDEPLPENIIDEFYTNKL